VNADHVAGRVRLQAVREESVWLEQVDRWNRKVSKLEKEHTIIPERLAKEVKLKTRVFGIPKVEPWLLPNKVRWDLCWDNQVVVGKVAAWVRETIQNTISNNYLASQTAGYLDRVGPSVKSARVYVNQGISLSWMEKRGK
jgi:hypothetical protein